MPAVQPASQTLRHGPRVRATVTQDGKREHHRLIASGTTVEIVLP